MSSIMLKRCPKSVLYCKPLFDLKFKIQKRNHMASNDWRRWSPVERSKQPLHSIIDSNIRFKVFFYGFIFIVVTNFVAIDPFEWFWREDVKPDLEYANQKKPYSDPFDYSVNPYNKMFFYKFPFKRDSE